jgi:hypothetical protein
MKKKLIIGGVCGFIGGFAVVFAAHYFGHKVWPLAGCVLFLLMCIALLDVAIKADKLEKEVKELKDKVNELTNNKS